jgi:hypothetical protein
MNTIESSKALLRLSALAVLPPDMRRLCRAVRNLLDYGLSPWFGLWPLKVRAKPDPK